MKEKVTVINFRDAFPEYDKEKPYHTSNMQITEKYLHSLTGVRDQA